MPDWFYRTVSRPLLFRLPPRTSRDLTLRFLGTLARLPLGPGIIDFLGHMRADSRLESAYAGVTFPTPVGLGPYLDTDALALPALARFGFGFIEIGPVTAEPCANTVTVERLPRDEAIAFSSSCGNIGLEALMPRLAEASRLGIPLVVRLGSRSGASASEAAEACRRMISRLTPSASLFALATFQVAVDAGWSVDEWRAHVQGIVNADRSDAASMTRPVLLCVPADADVDEADPLLSAAREAGVSGFVVDGCIGGGGDRRMVGAPAREASLNTARRLRERWGREPLIIASGGVHEPLHALELRSAGADLVSVDSGLIYAGPGLPKRINDALLFQKCRKEKEPPPSAEPPERPAEMTWLWTALMGAGMLWGSILALVIAATRIVLPYDEAFAGMSREQLSQINPRLLPFMAHDRVSLTGTMVAVGALYVGLSLFGVRRGLHWAQKSVFVSAFPGFASFFLFLGFGYLDTFHAFVTACLLQLLLLGVHSRLGTFHPAREEAPYLRSNSAWRWSLWGQLLLILHSVALIGAGLVIAVIGITSVFVPEDLMFMQTTADALRAANPRLVPLVAHDRATLGGMLLSSGLGFLLPALWGYRNGSAWLWRTFLLAGLCAYAAAIGVHLTVGYMNLHHLLPAFAGLGLFLTALGLSYPYLCRRDERNEADWRYFLPDSAGRY